MFAFLRIICFCFVGGAIAIDCPMGKIEIPPCGSPFLNKTDDCVPMNECLEKIQCPAGRVGTTCKPCDVTCENYRKPCLLICELGLYCTCPVGQVAKSREDPTCVPVSSCPSPALDCPMGKLESPPCGIPLMKDPDGECVPIDDCLKKIECPAGMVGTSCNPCDVTCEDYDEPCPLICEMGLYCTCPAGHVLISREDATCVPISSCPSAENEMSCGKSQSPPCGVCPSTCDKPTNVCPAICNLEETCVCAPGTLPRSDVNDTCVSINECIGNFQCPPDRVGTACEPCDANCENLSTAACPLICKIGFYCACPDGQVAKSKEDLTCVPISSCTAPDEFE
uniref:Uncharacterized protein HmEGFL-1 n=1 Tax=Herdmania momus TaxID=7733 RepID=O18464_HERMO|nr:unknown protein precursor [Herdmania momus]